MEKRSNLTNKDDKKIRVDYFAYIRIIVVLGIVIAIIYGIFLFLKKSLKIKEDTGEGATVIMSQSLGPGKWIQIVFVGGKYLILGITNENINLLCEVTDQKEIERYEIFLNQRKSEEGHTFKDIIGDFLKSRFNKKVEKEFDYENDSIDFLKKQKERLDKIDK